jgi:hypothetical protein
MASEAAAIGATVISTVGTIVSANDASAAARAEGDSARRVGDWQAAQLRQQAGQERAASQRQAEQERRAGRLAVSRARAISAGSGGGATDPTVLKIYGDLAAEGETNAMTALWEGEEAAKGLEAQAAGAEYEGQSAYEAGKYASRAYRRAGYLSAAGNLLAGGSDFYTKYGPTDTAPLSSNRSFNGGGKFGRLSSQVAY